MRSISAFAVCCAFCSGLAVGASPAGSLRQCKAAGVTVRAQLQGTGQSLLGAAVVTNNAARACELPVAPRRVTLVIGTQVLPALTVRMTRALEPSGTPTRRLTAHGHVTVGIQWRNWCGSPRGNVRLRLGLTIYSSETRRPSAGLVRTPVCVDPKYSSRVAVSRFIRK